MNTSLREPEVHSGGRGNLRDRRKKVYFKAIRNKHKKLFWSWLLFWYVSTILLMCTAAPRYSMRMHILTRMHACLNTALYFFPSFFSSDNLHRSSISNRGKYFQCRGRKMWNEAVFGILWCCKLHTLGIVWFCLGVFSVLHYFWNVIANALNVYVLECDAETHALRGIGTRFVRWMKCCSASPEEDWSKVIYNKHDFMLI